MNESTIPLIEIVVDADLTPAGAARLGALLSEALDQRPAKLVVDLGGCGYADARALQVLLDAHRRAWRAGGRLVLREPTPRLRRLLELAHLDHVFTIVPPAP
jgi:anti-anti-sigma factor